jgi:DNA-binding response OmpR family regulator
MEKLLILLVDDELDILAMLKMRLEANDFEVITAIDGLEALEKARNNKVALIILDLMLPKMDGYKVCRMLKFDERYRNIPVIILTARSQKIDKEMAEGVNADAYITKPFEPQELITKIQELLKNAHPVYRKITDDKEL